MEVHVHTYESFMIPRLRHLYVHTYSIDLCHINTINHSSAQAMLTAGPWHSKDLDQRNLMATGDKF